MNVTSITVAPACERARRWAALRPDGELSSIEGRMLDAHLERCSPCQVFADDVAAATEALRSAPAEEPSLAFDAAAARRLGRRQGAQRLARVSAAAAALIAAFGIGAIATGPEAGGEAQARPPVVLVVAGSQNEGDLVRAEQTALQRSWLVRTGRPYGVMPT